MSDTPHATNGGPVTVGLIALEAKHAAEMLAALAERVDERDAIRERHRIENNALEAKFRDAADLAEQRRVDANQAKSDANVGLANTRAEIEAKALADRVVTLATTLAAQVDATAKTNALVVEATTKALGERIAPLEQARYEQAGGKTQQSESRVQSNWTTERVMALIALVIAFAVLLHSTGIW